MKGKVSYIRQIWDIGELKKKTLFLLYFSISLFGLWAQQFTIPTGAELLESTEFKNNSVPYMIERRYKLPSGEILYAYYDVEGSNSVTIQKIEQTPLLALGTNVNIPGMPGYREFNFGNDNRKLVQFMKLFKLGQKDYRGNVKTPSLGDSIFTPYASGKDKDEFKLLLDLYDESWTLEHRYTILGDWMHIGNTELVRASRYSN
jgi:hypothetical protein